MLSTLMAIWFLHVAALMMPGPNVLLVSHLAASGNRRSASYAAVGIGVGAAVWATAAVLGVSALFDALPTARLLLQVTGALYLLYVAFRLWRSPIAAMSPSKPLTITRALRAGLLTNLSNPKSALFFASVFSAALPARPGNLLLASAVTLCVFTSPFWHLLIAFLFSRGIVQAGYAKQRFWLARLGGTVMGALGLSLLVASVREARR